MARPYDWTIDEVLARIRGLKVRPSPRGRLKRCSGSRLRPFQSNRSTRKLRESDDETNSRECVPAGRWPRGLRAGVSPGLFAVSEESPMGKLAAASRHLKGIVRRSRDRRRRILTDDLGLRRQLRPTRVAGVGGTNQLDRFNPSHLAADQPLNGALDNVQRAGARTKGIHTCSESWESR